MAKYLQIQIPKGCEESWDNMTQQHHGKFCGSCQKTVIDFTRMTDDQLVQFFKKRKDNVCGRFTSEQLNTDIYIPAKRIPWLKYFFTISIPAFLVSLKTTAQINNSKDLIEVTNSNKKLSDDFQKQSDEFKIITGTVTDEKGVPTSYATIKIKDTRKAVVADSNGRFSIKLDSSHSVIIVTSVGLISEQIDCRNKNVVNVILSRSEYQGSVGAIVITSYHKKKNRTASLQPLINNSFTLFPNPITSFSKLNINWSNAVTADQTIQVYNQSGVLLQQEIIKINKSSSQQALELKQLISGTYIIKITDNKTHKSSSQQFMVQ